MTERQVSTSQLTIRVYLDGHDDSFDVVTRWADSRLYETTAHKHKWPPFSESPFTWLGFMAWAAARRTGAIPTDMTWEKFSDALIHVENVDENVVVPTDAGAGPA